MNDLPEHSENLNENIDSQDLPEHLELTTPIGTDCTVNSNMHRVIVQQSHDIPLPIDLPDDLDIPFEYLSSEYIPDNIEWIDSSTFVNNAVITTAVVGGVLATVCSNSSKSPKSTKKNSNSKSPNSQKQTNQNKKTLPHIESDFSKHDHTLTLLGLKRSRTQPNTVGDGNCLFRAVFDQVTDTGLI